MPAQMEFSPLKSACFWPAPIADQQQHQQTVIISPITRKQTHTVAASVAIPESARHKQIDLEPALAVYIFHD
jgi:hypothetical protein